MEMKIFNLNTEKDFKKAERFKANLENKGLKVSTLTYSFNRVLIKGVC